MNTFIVLHTGEKVYMLNTRNIKIIDTLERNRISIRLDSGETMYADISFDELLMLLKYAEGAEVLQRRKEREYEQRV